jgi:hypothetical protein
LPDGRRTGFGPSAPDATAAVSGEHDFKSDDPEAAAAHIVVAKISFSYGN